jgi:hypothetical protein
LVSGYRKVQPLRPDHTLHKADSTIWPDILLTLLQWLNVQKGELIQAPNSLGFIPTTLDSASCRTLTDGVMNVWSLECFAMYLRNAIGNILGFRLVGTSVLGKEYIFGCAGQFTYQLSQEGQKKLTADYLWAVPPTRRHVHAGRFCKAEAIVLTSGEYQDAVAAYCASGDKNPYHWVSIECFPRSS